MDFLILIASLILLCLYLMRKQLIATTYIIGFCISLTFIFIIRHLLSFLAECQDIKNYHFHINNVTNVTSYSNLILYILVAFCFTLLLNYKLTEFKTLTPSAIIMILITIYGYILAINAETIFYLYLALEISAFSTYALLGMNSKRIFSNEGAIKYFLGNSLASILLLLVLVFYTY